MPPRFLHVSFNFPRQSKVEELEPIFDKARDWVRYAPNCWIIWTSVSPRQWLGRLRPVLRSGEHVLICRVDLQERAGWLPGWVWEWIDRSRADRTGHPPEAPVMPPPGGRRVLPPE
jgi:hypothetical protein